VNVFDSLSKKQHHYDGIRPFDLECQFFRSWEGNTLRKDLLFVTTMAEFLTNFENRYKASLWMQTIDFKNFHISGGCIVDSLCKDISAGKMTESVDLNFNGRSFHEFESGINHVYDKLAQTLSKNGHFPAAVLVKKDNGSYTIVLQSDIRLQFNFKNVPDMAKPVSYVLHSSDIDASQVAFTGKTNRNEQESTLSSSSDRFAHRLYRRLLASPCDQVVHLLFDAWNYVEKYMRQIHPVLSTRIHSSRTSGFRRYTLQ
jgi:hypothetical protein